MVRSSPQAAGSLQLGREARLRTVPQVGRAPQGAGHGGHQARHPIERALVEPASALRRGALRAERQRRVLPREAGQGGGSERGRDRLHDRWQEGGLRGECDVQQRPATITVAVVAAASAAADPSIRRTRTRARTRTRIQRDRVQYTYTYYTRAPLPLRRHPPRLALLPPLMGRMRAYLPSGRAGLPPCHAATRMPTPTAAPLSSRVVRLSPILPGRDRML